MSYIARTTATVSLLILICLLLAPGCSHDGPFGPAPDVQKAAGPNAPGPEPENFFVESFENRRNVGGWSFHTTSRLVYEEAGGNPDGYLHDDHVVSFAPHPGTEPGEDSIFTGNYREAGVTSLGIDLRSINYEYDITNRYLTLILMNDNGTPSDFDDDWGAYVIGDVKLPSKYTLWKSAADTPSNQPGWVSYDFEIASQANGLPEGWTFMRWTLGGGDMPGGSWTELMENVSYVQYFYGDPNMYYIIQSLDLGLDNARISFD